VGRRFEKRPPARCTSRTGLGSSTPDRRIWDDAGQNGFTIIAADTDFMTLVNTLGPPSKVIVLENGHYPMGAVVARPG
jgi:predicted nuclease of predicted toxin-antitoxin system